MKFEHTEVFNFGNALRGMRNPLESWDKSDSGKECYYNSSKPCDPNCYCLTCGSTHKFIIGENDLKLAQKLIKAGSEHRKFMRQIMVSVDITAPVYWWRDMDQYKVGTTTNSTSTMHKLATTPITLDRFETDDYSELTFEKTDQSGVTEAGKEMGYTAHWHLESEVEKHLEFLEDLRKKYLETKDQRYWKELVRWLPNGWVQTRTITMNYENILNICKQRKNHKLTEWSKGFIGWAKTLPYAQELIFIDEVE